MIRFYKTNPMQDIDLSVFEGFFSYDCYLSAIEQIEEAYKFAGGWRDIEGFALKMRQDGLIELEHPKDYPLPGFVELARAMIGTEIVIVFQSDFVAVLQPDNTYRVARID